MLRRAGVFRDDRGLIEFAVCRKYSKLSASKIAEKKQVLDNISAEHAYEILKRLADEDVKISKRIEKLALEYLIEVNPDDIADNVFYDLDSIEVEDVWKNSGRTRYGYVDPYELASEMFEEALEPYVDKLRKCQKLSITEFQDWAVDDPYENFIRIFKEWRKETKDTKNLEEMGEFVKKNYPEWYKDIMKK